MTIENLTVKFNYQDICEYEHYQVFAAFMDNKLIRFFTLDQHSGEVY